MLRSKDYPPSLAMEIDVPLLPHEEVGAYIKRRLEMHVQIFNDPNSIPCSAKEMWATADTFKVKKVSGKNKAKNKSLKNFDKRSLAAKFLENNSFKHVGGLYIEHVPGENRRCNEFCPVAAVCPQKRMNDIRIETLKNAE